MSGQTRLVNHPFEGRTIQVVGDLSVDEQLYLYEKTRELKAALQSGGDAAAFRLSDPDAGVYLFFMEDSTRTRESFRNAVKFHNLKVNDFAAASSSVNKNESITDTVRMLVGYSTRSIFVVRTKLEGTCRWLESAIGGYTRKLGLPPAAFINAGDGRHEHPTQEFLDEFTFLEHKRWDRSSIHLALVGDLFHGRTVHSKVEGLRVFKEVRVDLVAPSEISMPEHYTVAMRDAGFDVRIFGSIAEYLAQTSVARIWYFTRLQLERMGERLRDKAETLRDAVTFREEFAGRVPEGCRFYHPLPRHRVTPTIPPFLDATPLNGWDEQSMNGYFTRIIEIAMVGGRLGAEFSGGTVERPEYPDDFVQQAEIEPKVKPEYKIGIKPVDNGIVIDHVGRGQSPREIWDQIDKIRRILRLDVISSHGVYHSQSSGRYKGLISLPSVREFDESQIKMLGASAPGCTLNIIESGNVIQKYRMTMPRRVYRLPGIGCKNEDCISYADHHEPVAPEFYRAAGNTFVCKYCERPHAFHEIW